MGRTYYKDKDTGRELEREWITEWAKDANGIARPVGGDYLYKSNDGFYIPEPKNVMECTEGIFFTDKKEVRRDGKDIIYQYIED